MKIFCLLSLLFLSACSTATKLTTTPLPSSTEESVRRPEIIGTYHLGRYADTDSLLHESHAVYRVEQNARWNFQPTETTPENVSMPRNAAFNPTPFNDAILAEVNSQKLATAQIVTQSRILTASLAQFQSALSQSRTNLQQVAALRNSVAELQRRLDALDNGSVPLSTRATNDPSMPSHNDPLDP